ncbi:hypothetical protein ACFSX9_10800 [Flavobacterium ardleyense]|uniref:Leucine-rich repeat domain-containing protein n=1 Tax=Flavobacterium ardleyense TaxID=2038737 RepID=A0ABW5ZA96_9FLAO
MKTLYSKLKANFLKSRTNKWSFSFVEEEREENGVVYKEFNNFPPKELYSKIEAITFLVYDDDLEKVKSKPDFLTELRNLEVLDIPIDWLCHLEFPINIKALSLIDSIHTQTKYEWCNGLILKDLKYLGIPEQINPFNIDFNNVPSLEWISLDLKAEKKAEKLNDLSKIKTLRHLILSQAKNFDVFTPFLAHNIESIELFSCKGNKFPIQNIQLLQDLKYIKINNISVAFDCSWLLKLPNLIELEILNVKNVVNVKELLKIKTLKSISILNCNDPFENKEEFKSKNFQLLKIDYA